ncbi:IPT/TIG domain-containing protein [Candidatus Daviesbacteria bacterium]|nr:IPT/TIG domain-containing protein [Candidatus Daviesbacteria bacterium]
MTFVRGGQFYLEVETADGQRSNRLPFTVVAGQPYIESISPSVFKKGSTITITGTEFGSSTGKVNFNSNSGYGNLLGYGIIGSWTDTQIIFTVPSSLESKEYALEIITSDGRKSSYKYFNVTD